MKQKLKVLLLFFVMSVLLSACTINLDRSASIEEELYEDKYDIVDRGPVKGGAIRLFSTPVDTLNPILTSNIYVQDFLGFVFEGLYTINTEQQLVPVLAKSSMLSADGLTLTIYLKDNVKWHDKMPFKSEDVVFTINTLLDKNITSVYKKNVQYIESAASSGNSVIIKLKQPYSLIKYELTFPILPAHHFLNEKLADKKSKANLSPVGTGPYALNSYNEENGVKLKLNEEWWNAEEDKVEEVSKPSGSKTGETPSDSNKVDLKLPYLSTIEIKIFNNTSSANAAFQARDIDVLPAQYSEYRKYIGRTDITLKRFPGKNFEFLALNTKKGVLTDKRLRNALNYLIDKKQLVDTAASGIATPAEIPINPNSWIHQLVNFDQNDGLSKAKELLTQSGYVLDSKKKYVKKGSKKELTLKMIVNEGNSLRFNTATEISSQLEKKGIAVEVVKLPWESYINTLKTGAYDLALSGYRLSSVPDLTFAYSSAEIQSGLNVAGYSNPTADQYLQQILVESNTETQKSLYKSLLNVVAEDRPYIGLFFLNESMMYSKNIRGAVNPHVWNKFSDITKWYLP